MKKLSLGTILGDQFLLLGLSTDHNMKLCGVHYNFNAISVGNDNFKKSLHIKNIFKERLQQIFMLLNYIFITDVAKYLFLMYYDVVFG